MRPICARDKAFQATCLLFLPFLSSFRFPFAKMSEPYTFYETQTVTATKILDAFAANKRQVLLSAQMQSGKSGVFLFVACRMLTDRIVGRVVIICGSNETELHKQMNSNWNRAVRKFVVMIGLRGDDAEDKITALSGRVQIIKSTGADGLARAELIKENTLLIWDESHFAQKTDNLPYKFIQDSELSVSGTAASDAKWQSKNCYFLSVSATPFAEFCDTHNKEFVKMVTRTVVYHEPDAEHYRGVKFYKENGVIRSSFSLKTEGLRFRTILRRFAESSKYALVRSRNLTELKALCEAEGVRFQEYTSTRADLSGIDELDRAPISFTVIGLKGMCRMGKEVPKRNIAFVFEEAKASKSDCILQSFLGRMCGHGPWGAAIPEIYVPASFTSPHPKYHYSEVERYIRFTDGEIIAPAKADCIGKMAGKSGKLTLEVKRIPLGEDPENYEEADAVRDARGSERRDRFIAAAMHHIVGDPYSDPIQQEDVLDRLAASAVEVHDMNAASYDYVRDADKGLIATLAKGDRWDDHWNDGKNFKFYYNGTELYLVGHTEDASDETKKECRNAIVPTTAKEAFSPLSDNRVAQILNIVHNDAELTGLKERLTTAGEHTLFVHKSLVSNPFIQFILKNARKGKGGKNWPRSEKAVRTDFERIVLLVTIEIKVTISAFVF